MLVWGLSALGMVFLAALWCNPCNVREKFYLAFPFDGATQAGALISYADSAPTKAVPILREYLRDDRLIESPFSWSMSVGDIALDELSKIEGFAIPFDVREKRPSQKGAPLRVYRLIRRQGPSNSRMTFGH